MLMISEKHEHNYTPIMSMISGIMLMVLLKEELMT